MPDYRLSQQLSLAPREAVDSIYSLVLWGLMYMIVRGFLAHGELTGKCVDQSVIILADFHKLLQELERR